MSPSPHVARRSRASPAPHRDRGPSAARTRAPTPALRPRRAPCRGRSARGDRGAAAPRPRHPRRRRSRALPRALRRPVASPSIARSPARAATAHCATSRRPWRPPPRRAVSALRTASDGSPSPTCTQSISASGSSLARGPPTKRNDSSWAPVTSGDDAVPRAICTRVSPLRSDHAPSGLPSSTTATPRAPSRRGRGPRRTRWRPRAVSAVGGGQ